jgi:hypothetical protein
MSTPSSSPHPTVRSKREFLRSISLFSRLPAAAIDRLVLSFESHVFTDGDVIFRQGDEGDRMYLVESGRVNLMRTDGSGRRRKLGTVDAGGYFGELALLSDKPRAATAECAGDVELFSIAGRDLKRLLAESAPALRSVVGSVAEYHPPDRPVTPVDRLRHWWHFRGRKVLWSVQTLPRRPASLAVAAASILIVVGGVAVLPSVASDGSSAPASPPVTINQDEVRRTYGLSADLLARAENLIQGSPTVSLPAAPVTCVADVPPETAPQFLSLKLVLGARFGEPVECGQRDPTTNDLLQQTSTGVARYRQQTDIPTFSDGVQSWALTSTGLVTWTGSDLDPPPLTPR